MRDLLLLIRGNGAPPTSISVHPNSDRLLTPLLQELVYHKTHDYKRENKLFLLNIQYFSFYYPL